MPAIQVKTIHGNHGPPHTPDLPQRVSGSRRVKPVPKVLFDEPYAKTDRRGRHRSCGRTSQAPDCTILCMHERVRMHQADRDAARQRGAEVPTFLTEQISVLAPTLAHALPLRLLTLGCIDAMPQSATGVPPAPESTPRKPQGVPQHRTVATGQGC